MRNDSKEEKKEISTRNKQERVQDINEHRNKQKMVSMWKESGELMSDREEILI